MWLTAKNAPLWHFGYTYTEWGGMAHAVPSQDTFIIYKKFTAFITLSNNLLYLLSIYIIIHSICTVGNYSSCDILKFFFRV